jgi:hypothetical protein
LNYVKQKLAAAFSKSQLLGASIYLGTGEREMFVPTTLMSMMTPNGRYQNVSSPDNDPRYAYQPAGAHTKKQNSHGHANERQPEKTSQKSIYTFLLGKPIRVDAVTRQVT